MVSKAIAFASTLFLIASQALAWDAPKMDKEINNGLYTLEDTAGRDICSAFDAPEQNIVVTAAHCVTGQIKQDKDFTFTLNQSWETAKGVRYAVSRRAKLVKVIPGADWAILKVIPDEIYHRNTAVFSSDDPVRGEDVYVAGMPYGQINTLTKGIMSNPFKSLPALYGNLVVYQVDATIGPGNSGGPVYNDKGEVIGIVSSTMGSPAANPLGAWSNIIPIKFLRDSLANV